MRLKGLRKTTLLSLLGLSSTSSAQTSSWGEPFSVEGPSSSEDLIATSSGLASSASSIAKSHVSSAAASDASKSAAASTTALTDSISSETSSDISSDSTFTVTLPSTTQSPLTVSTPIGTGVTAAARSGTNTNAGSAPTTKAQVPDANGSTGAASVPMPYVRMGVAGVMAAAAGVFIV